MAEKFFTDQDSETETSIDDLVASVMASIKLKSDCEAIIRDIKPGDARMWGALRKLYRTINVNDYDPYIIDWMPFFSPIEAMAWGEIRYWNLPLWPQYPIGRFFADFACPQKKIVIECDGKEFHDEAKDRARDFEMAQMGWQVYRISGADCNRILNHPWTDIADQGIEGDKANIVIRKWMYQTVDGLVAAIAQVHFGRHVSNGYFAEAADELLAFRSQGVV